MDPLPVLKEEEKDKEEDWTLREDDDGNDTDGEDAVGNLWTLGGDMQPGWSDTGATLFVTSGMGAPDAAADLTATFLEHVAHLTESIEPEKPLQDLEEFA
jgi:hypothetical protein